MKDEDYFSCFYDLPISAIDIGRSCYSISLIELFIFCVFCRLVVSCVSSLMRGRRGMAAVCVIYLGGTPDIFVLFFNELIVYCMNNVIVLRSSWRAVIRLVLEDYYSCTMSMVCLRICLSD